MAIEPGMYETSRWKNLLYTSKFLDYWPYTKLYADVNTSCAHFKTTWCQNVNYRAKRTSLFNQRKALAITDILNSFTHHCNECKIYILRISFKNFIVVHWLFIDGCPLWDYLGIIGIIYQDAHLWNQAAIGRAIMTGVEHWLDTPLVLDGNGRSSCWTLLFWLKWRWRNTASSIHTPAFAFKR